MDTSLRTFIEAMPKVELHTHLEGTLEPELALKLAEAKDMTLYSLSEADREAIKDNKRSPLEVPSGSDLASQPVEETYRFNNLVEFLTMYYQNMQVLQTKDDFKALTKAYMQKAHEQGVVHTEMFFDPQVHADNGVPLQTVVDGITEARDEAEREWGMSSKLICHFLRDKSQDDAMAMFEQTKPFVSTGEIDGYGLDSAEMGNPPEKFTQLYEQIHAFREELGRTAEDFVITAHAGEEGPAEYVRQAVDGLKVDRIDHGNRTLEDKELTARLAEQQIGMTVCPYSNLRLMHQGHKTEFAPLDDMRHQSLKDMLDAGLAVSVHSDDPAYFRVQEGDLQATPVLADKVGHGAYITENYLAVAEALNLSREDIVKLAENAIETAALSPKHKEALKERLEQHEREYPEAKLSYVGRIKEALATAPVLG